MRNVLYRLPLTVLKPARPGFVLINNGNNINIINVFKRINPYITATDDVSFLGLLNLLRFTKVTKEAHEF